jgi:RHS repeat-associated protein
MSDMSGNIAEGPYVYDPYGNCRSGSGTCSTGVPFRYTGQRLDPETNLYYYRARMYSSALGRFLQVDPIGYKDDLDLYAYVGNDPTDKTDPTGKVISCADKSDCGTIAGMINARASGTYKFDSKGHLQRVGTKDNSHRSTYYSKKLDAAIGAKDNISVDIASKFVDPQSGATKSVDKDAGGGVTIGAPSGGNQAVTISGRPLVGLQDTAGKPLRDNPGDILAHELVGHAIPHIVGPDTGNAVQDENKVRSQIPGGDQRAPEPWHTE